MTVRVAGADGENPYRPPGRATASPEESRRIGWKLYLGLLVFIYALIYPILGVDWVQLLDLVDTAANGIGMAGLFGYAFRRRLGTAAFWKGWLPAQVAWNVVALVVLEPLGMIQNFEQSEPLSATDLLIEAAVMLPLYIALFRYGFRSPEIWRRGAAT